MNLQTLLDPEQLLDDLHRLGEIGRAPEGGLQRIAFNPDDSAGRRWIEQKMVAAGMSVRVDTVGNTIATYPGNEELPAIAIGSHTDTVPGGGVYDGALGVLAGLACVRTLHAANLRLRHPIELINFVAEEATMAGGTLGSLVMTGSFNPATLQQSAWDGKAVREHLLATGLDPDTLSQAQRQASDFAAFLELHIEQGGRLAEEQIEIGVVEGIVGIRRYLVTFHGYANHAGTTPMKQRQDALVLAAPFIGLVPQVALEHAIVGTIGKVEVLPGAPNVIPGEVRLHLEIRGLDEAILDSAEATLQHHAEKAQASFARLSQKAAVHSDQQLLQAIHDACETLQFSRIQMPSGAGHDAMNMATLCPFAMIFVPSQNGVSHSPDEFTLPEDCVNGARVLLETLLRVDHL